MKEPKISRKHEHRLKTLANWALAKVLVGGISVIISLDLVDCRTNFNRLSSSTTFSTCFYVFPTFEEAKYPLNTSYNVYKAFNINHTRTQNKQPLETRNAGAIGSRRCLWSTCVTILRYIQCFENCSKITLQKGFKWKQLALPCACLILMSLR